MTTNVTTIVKMVEAASTRKITAKAKALGYFKSGKDTVDCPKCSAKAGVYKNGKRIICACACGWRKLEVTVVPPKVSHKCAGKDCKATLLKADVAAGITLCSRCRPSK